MSGPVRPSERFNPLRAALGWINAWRLTLGLLSDREAMSRVNADMSTDWLLLDDPDPDHWDPNLDHAPQPGPLYWSWRCLVCSEPVADHPSWLTRTTHHLRRNRLR